VIDSGDEFSQKQARILALLAERKLDALLLRRVSSFAWATCGARSHVNMASTTGVASLLITPTGLHLIADNLDAPRLREEEGLREQGWKFHVRHWYQRDEALQRLTRGLRLGADGAFHNAVDLSADLALLRSRLTPQEVQRMRLVSQLTSRAVTQAALTIHPNQTELQISARLAFEALRLGVEPLINIVAADDRIPRYRHPLPTDRPLERYAMLVLNGRKWGLVSSVTRFVHFGPLPSALRRAHETVAGIAALCISETQPGRRLGDILEVAMAQYAAAGKPQAWRAHHQGGAAGYEPREFLITPGMAETAAVGQVFVWNPSLGAARSVDTFMVDGAGNEVLTVDPDWPTWAVSASGSTWLRPGVLEIPKP
jgi:antitoxin VapB